MSVKGCWFDSTCEAASATLMCPPRNTFVCWPSRATVHCDPLCPVLFLRLLLLFWDQQLLARTQRLTRRSHLKPRLWAKLRPDLRPQTRSRRLEKSSSRCGVGDEEAWSSKPLLPCFGEVCFSFSLLLLLVFVPVPVLVLPPRPSSEAVWQQGVGRSAPALLCLSLK